MDRRMSIPPTLPNLTGKTPRSPAIVHGSANPKNDHQQLDKGTVTNLGQHAGKDKGFVIVKGTDLVPLVARRQGQESNHLQPNSNKHPATTAPMKSRQQSYWNTPPTTYRRHLFKPHIYDNTIMLTEHPGKKSNVSRSLGYADHFNVGGGAERRERRTHVVGVDPGWFPRRGQSARIHAAKTTNVLFQTLPLQFDNYGVRSTGISTSQLPMPYANSSYLSFSTPIPSSTWERRQNILTQPYSNATPVIDESSRQRTMLKNFRFWEYSTLGKVLGEGHSNSLTGGGTRFTLLNYNILAQVHLETHQYLYKNCSPEALGWQERAHLLFRDIDELSPDLLCFQEVEEAEFHYTLVPALDHAGYRGVFKKRTRDKPDGCCIFWSKEMFGLVGKLSVDLYQPHVPLLDRDNVSLMVKLESKMSGTQERLVVATTHLLFNPKRTDVKLAQVQLLLAELDRFSFSGMNEKGESVYYPLLLCGDFNTEPYSSIHRLITEGSLRNLGDRDYLPKSFKKDKDAMLDFLPPYFGISDQCQHYKIQLERFKQWKSFRRGRFELDRRIQANLINVSSERRPPTSANSESTVYDDNVSNPTSQNEQSEVTLRTELNASAHMHVLEEMRQLGVACSFGSGTLSHGLKLRNIYEPKLDRRENGENVATTKQSAWKCVDFIFQGMEWNAGRNRQSEGSLKLIRRLGLPTRSQCKELGTIPNFVTSSDHYPLVAEFLLK